MLSIVCNQNTVLKFHCTVYFKHVLFCPGQGNRFPKMLDLYMYIKVLLKCNESGCYLFYGCSTILTLYREKCLTGYIPAM